MPALSYDVIYSRMLSRVSAYDFVSVDNETIQGMMLEWLRSSIYKPHIRRLFSELTLSDTDKKVDYSLVNSVDASSDNEFVIEIVSIGMAMCWLAPKINAITNIAQLFTTSEEKFYSQSNHLAELQSLYSSLESEQKRIIGERTITQNEYFGG